MASKRHQHYPDQIEAYMKSHPTGAVEDIGTNTEYLVDLINQFGVQNRAAAEEPQITLGKPRISAERVGPTMDFTESTAPEMDFTQPNFGIDMRDPRLAGQPAIDTESAVNQHYARLAAQQPTQTQTTASEVAGDQAAPVMDFTQEAAPASTPEDALLAKYNKRIADLDRERSSMLEKAAGEREYSDKEKIAMALISALPGLLGAGLGGAIAGGQGAAAGAAGGLQGSANALGTMQQGKESRRKEFKGDADKARELGDVVSQAADARTVQLERTKQQEAQRGQDHDWSEAAREKDQKFRASESAKERANRIALERMTQEGISARADAAGPKPEKMSAGDEGFLSNSTAALRMLDEFEQVVAGVPAKDGTKGKPGYGNWEGPLGNADARAALKALPYKLAIAYAKIVDPASVAREGEVQAAEKYVIPAGLGEKNSVTLAAIARMRKDLQDRMAERAQIKAGGASSSPEGSPPAQSSDPFAKGKRRGA